MATTLVGLVTLAASATVTQGVTGQVIASGGGLRLRQSPGTAGAIIDSLSAFDQLEIVGRIDGQRLAASHHGQS